MKEDQLVLIDCLQELEVVEPAEPILSAICPIQRMIQSCNRRNARRQQDAELDSIVGDELEPRRRKHSKKY